MKRSVRVIVQGIGIVILLLALVGCQLIFTEDEVLEVPEIKPPELNYNTVEARKGDLEKTVSGSGTFVSVEGSTFFFKHSSGRLKAFHVKLGEDIKKGDIIAELDTSGLNNRIKQQRIVLQKAQTYYNSLKKQGADKYTRNIAWYDVELAQKALDDLELQKKQATIVSDVDGRVTYINNNVREGEYVNAYEPMARVATEGELYLVYSGMNNSEFYVGMPVEAIIDDRTYNGTVVMTPMYVPQDAPGDLSNVIVMSISDIPDEIAMGDDAQFTVVRERREDTVIVPRNAIRNFMGRKYVLVLEDGIKKERDVEVGLENNTEAEIVKGLEGGEDVIV